MNTLAVELVNEIDAVLQKEGAGAIESATLAEYYDLVAAVERLRNESPTELASIVNHLSTSIKGNVRFLVVEDLVYEINDQDFLDLDQNKVFEQALSQEIRDNLLIGAIADNFNNSEI